MSLSVSLIAIIVFIGLGFAAPTGTHPFFYFGLAFFGGGAISLLFGGIGVVFARDRTPSSPSLDSQFFGGVRTMMMAMWLCALVMDGLGTLIVRAIAGGRGGTTPLSTGVLVIAFTVATVTVICAGVTAVVMRRRLRRG
ncbi:hypothetical protein FNH05_08995 [Amycolatopsis rhizosphaerae]|uniref:Uncharacterized protein n=2 Tax=Amycolatopsis TaxID=1813 RepID=A0A558D4B1_9PSEU|nr:hypothetical protein FNH05_08995 [Amycolatopsis rhizosphaerae]